MASCLVGGLVDTGLTATALSIPGFKEVGIIGSGLVELGSFDTVAMARIGVTALMIGLYAVAKKDGSRFTYSFEKSLQISNVIVWSINIINAAQIIYEVLPKS